VESIQQIHDTPSGSVDIVTFSLSGHRFMAISAGPLFKFNPSVSFIVGCTTKEEVDALWAALSDGGAVLMELGEYPFSKRYGWCADKYGLSWQIILTDPSGEERPKIVPSLLFVGDVCGKAEEAINFYLSAFNPSKMGNLYRYGAGQEPDKEGNVMFADFKLLGRWFAAMDSAREHNFKFNEAISFMVSCETQEEIDYYWEKLSAVPEAEQCGWLKDRYGLSWQIVPRAMDELMASDDKEKLARVTQAMLKMKKFDIAALKAA
jgi:predicted 3-demethylubiquinone-9 3-methyltransferase (glyoxalase superfamily)